MNQFTNIIKKTPLEFCQRLSQRYKANIYLKREDLQTVRSFKIRGAFNKIHKNYQSNSHFVTASAGNHAQGVAYACQQLGQKCHIFVPENTPLQKISRIKYFGDEQCHLKVTGKNFSEALSNSLQFCQQHQGIFVHPFDDQDVIDGQGTIGSEILESFKPDIVLAGVGGGGLLSGLIKNLPETDIIGVEPKGAASMYQSLKQNKLVTLENIDSFVDGASVSQVGKLNFEIAKKSHQILKVSNGNLSSNMIELYQNEGIICEPAGALSVTGLTQLDQNYLEDKKIVCIVSGGNNDLLRYPEIIENSLRYQNLKHYYIIKFQQKPGQLKKYVKEILPDSSDITRFEYIKKNNRYDGTVLIGIEVINPLDNQKIKNNMSKYNFNFIEISEQDLLYNYLI